MSWLWWWYFNLGWSFSREYVNHQVWRFTRLANLDIETGKTQWRMSSTNSKKEESTLITIKLLVRRLTTRPKSSSNWSLTSFSVLQEVQLSEENNRWIWRYNKEVIFNVASAYHIQFHLMYPSNTHVEREISTFPIISDSWPPI